MKHVTPLKSIRLKCLDCSETAREVKECPVKDCALWPYRLGKRPKTAERQAEVREAKKRGTPVPRGTAKDEFGNLEGTQASEINKLILGGCKSIEEVVKATGYSTSRVVSHLKYLTEKGHVKVKDNKIIRRKK